MKERPKEKIDLEKIMQRIREINNDNDGIDSLCGFGLMKDILPQSYPLSEIVKTSEHREYTDNGLAGTWFNNYEKALKPKARDFKFIEADTMIENNGLKMAVNYD